MSINEKELKKNTLILSKIFEIAVSIREECDRSIEQKGHSIFLGAWQHTQFHADLECSDSPPFHAIYSDILDNYDYDVKKLFLAAANQQMDFIKGKMFAEIEDDFLEVYNIDLERYQAWEEPKEIIEERAERGLKELEQYIASL